MPKNARNRESHTRKICEGVSNKNPRRKPLNTRQKFSWGKKHGAACKEKAKPVVVEETESDSQEGTDEERWKQMLFGTWTCNDQFDFIRNMASHQTTYLEAR